jgi:hypothetical protein
MKFEKLSQVKKLLFGNCENVTRMPHKPNLKSFFNQEFFSSRIYNCDAFELKFAELTPAELLLFVNCRNASRRKLHYFNNDRTKKNSPSNDNSLLAKSGQTCLEYGFLKVFGRVKLARLEIFLYSVAVLRNDQVPFSSLLIQHLKNQGVNRFSVREQMFIFAAPLI